MAAAGNDSPKKKRTADDNIKRHKHVSVSISDYILINRYLWYLVCGSTGAHSFM